MFVCLFAYFFPERLKATIFYYPSQIFVIRPIIALPYHIRSNHISTAPTCKDTITNKLYLQLSIHKQTLQMFNLSCSEVVLESASAKHDLYTASSQVLPSRRSQTRPPPPLLPPPQITATISALS